MPSMSAVQAYRRSAQHRSTRDREADVFHYVNRCLRSALDSGPQEVPQAVADNERLWITVMDMLSDPSNGLSTDVRAAILSVGHAVRREVKSPNPDVPFLIGINEQIAAGLAGR